MGFKTRKVNEVKEYKSIKDMLKSYLSISFISKFVIVIVAFSLIVFLSGYAIIYSKQFVDAFSMQALKIISNNIGEELKTDDLGQVNVLIVGYGGKDHQGGYLTDTIMIASFNPELGAVTFVSIPRDLYVKYENGYSGKINALFANNYYKYREFDKAAGALSKKIEEISDMDIKYYALVDFDGFVSLIDKMGGVSIDVPEDLIDKKYPTINGGYTTFKVTKGLNHFNGSIALKYARSRHSTSDFSRALRQQQIIKAIVSEVLSKKNLTSINKIQDLYSEYNKMVYTNISIKNMIGMAKYIDKLNHFFSFVLTAECDWNNYKYMEKACLLYYPPRESFNGLSTMLPIGSSNTSMDNYKRIQDFIYLVAYKQGFLIEDAKIKILNAIDKTILRQHYGYSYPVANKLAVQLINNGFQISDIGNNDEVSNTTILYQNGTGDYSTTIDLLKMFIQIDSIMTGNIDFDNDMTLVLGNSYIK